MNKEHRYNTLTQSLITDITRGIDTMNNDHTLHAIYVTTEKGEHWSHGSDFQSILHMKNEDNYSKIQEYMNALYHL
jgi:enoyl-CoA hydratase/carnithine racemase